MHESLGYSPVEDNPVQEFSLSEQEMGVLVSYLGNHEIKALLLDALSNTVLQTGHELHVVINRAQGRRPTWNIPAFRINLWCEMQFLPLGIISGNHELGYVLTSFGREQVGLVGHLLELSEQYPSISLFGAFGLTYTKKKDDDPFTGVPPALIHYQIFQAIRSLGEAPLSAKAIVDKTKVNFTKISDRLSHLSNHNVLKYVGRPADEDYSYFRLGTNRPEGQPSAYRREKKLTQIVYEIFCEQPDKKFSIAQLYEQVILKDPKVANLKNIGVFNRLSNIANWLQNGRYVDQGIYSKEKQSNILISEDQKQFIKDVLDILDTWRKRDPTFIEVGIQKAKEIFSDPVRVARLVEKAKEGSPQTKKQLSTTLLDHTEAILTEHTGIATKELQRLLQERTGRKYSKVRITQLGRQLRESKRKIKAVKKTGYHYSPEDSESEE